MIVQIKPRWVAAGLIVFFVMVFDDLTHYIPQVPRKT